jgi:large subunit ribosomal protein L9
MAMKVLLWNDVDKLGKRGEVVNVKDGYARNFLFPRKLASQDTESMRKELELAKRRTVKQDAQLVIEAKEVAEKLVKVPSVTVEVNANAEGHLYGTVTPSMIAEALRGEQGLKVDAKCIGIVEPIKQIGTYDVEVELHRDVKHKLKVWVISTKAVKPPSSSSEKSEKSEKGDKEKKSGAPAAPKA